jgi:hypothetical protein
MIDDTPSFSRVLVKPCNDSGNPVAYRDPRFIVNIAGSWIEPHGQDAHIGWTRACWEALQPCSMGSGYVNFLTADELAGDDPRVRAAYGPNYARLAAIKTKWDAANLFRSNQNIRPAA